MCTVSSNKNCTPCDLMEVPMDKIFRYARVCATCGDLYGADIENCCFCHSDIRHLCRDACGWHRMLNVGYRKFLHFLVLSDIGDGSYVELWNQIMNIQDNDMEGINLMAFSNTVTIVQGSEITEPKCYYRYDRDKWSWL